MVIVDDGGEDAGLSRDGIGRTADFGDSSSWMMGGGTLYRGAMEKEEVAMKEYSWLGSARDSRTVGMFSTQSMFSLRRLSHKDRKS